MANGFSLGKSLVKALPLLLAIALPTEAFGQRITFGGGGASSSSAAPPPAPKPTSTTPASNGGTATPAGSASTTVDDRTPEEKAQDLEWADRDKWVNESNSLAGGVGLMHVMHAQSGAPGQFRLSFMTEFFSAGFLCTETYACPDRNTGAPGAITNDGLNHIGGTINLSVSILKWLEAYASTGAYANSDDANRPTLLQVLGDTYFGAKVYGGGFGNVFYLGGAAELRLLNGSGAVGLAGGATSARFMAIPTIDLRGLESRVPFRASMNFAYFVDNSSAVIKDFETSQGKPVTRIERFGLKVNRVDHFDIGVGLETFFVEDRIRPFLEYNVAIPINRQGYTCDPNNANGDGCLANDQVAPSSLTIGGRFFPWKRGFGITAAFDIGTTGTSKFIEEVSPTPPWMLYLGLGWNVDTQDRPPVRITKTVEKIIEKKPPVLGKIKGFVHEKDKTDVGLPNAILMWDNHPELTGLVTGPDGRFSTQTLPEGNYTFNVKADGFKDGQCGGQLPKGGADVQIDCALEALPRVGNVIGHVKDAETLGPIAGAVVKLTDSQGKPLQVTSDSSGGYRFEGVNPGTASIAVDMEEYLAFVDSTDVKIRQDVVFDPMVRHKPKTALVAIGKTEITIKQQIQFALDQAVILPESIPLLNEIADTIIKNPRLKKIEIQGHTDNSGTPDHNQVLSDQRAEAVKKWLTDHGVPPSSVVAKGYGQSKPLVPNVTAANKAKNRRVQFIIIDQDPATPATPPPPGKPPTKPPF